MLFKRREAPSLWERVRVALWPRRSWSRSFRYVMQRLWRLRGSPQSIALGCAAGVFVSFTPFLGIHFILAGTIAWIIGGNILASALGTFFGNPLTFPLIWISTFKTGNWLMGSSSSMEFHDIESRLTALTKGLLSTSIDGVMQAVDTFWPIMKPMAVGAVPLGLVTSIISFYIIRKMVETYQSRRSMRQAEAAFAAAAGTAEPMPGTNDA